MRARYLGAFADLLGIRPWEWDLLEVGEAIALTKYVDAVKEAMTNGG